MTVLLSRGDLEALNQPTGRATGLPRHAFIDQAFLDAEYERVFAPTWIYAGAAGAIPNPGDALPAEIAGTPIVLVRGRDRRVRAFHNICRHRGAIVVPERCAGKSVLACPYHGWSYDLDGALLRTPHIGGMGRHECDGIDRATLGLRPVRCDSWGELLFVNLDGKAPALADFIAPLKDRWRDYDMTRLRYGGSWDYALACNWKLAVENFLESYHLPWVHPNLASYSRVEDHYIFNVADLAYGQGTRVYAPDPLPGGEAFPMFETLSEADRRRAEYPILFPNLLCGMHADHFYAINVIPDGPGRTKETVDIFYIGEAATQGSLAPARAANAARWDAVFVEDVGIVESAHAGRMSPAMDGGRFSPDQDWPLHLFERTIADRVMAAT